MNDNYYNLVAEIQAAADAQRELAAAQQEAIDNALALQETSLEALKIKMEQIAAANKKRFPYEGNRRQRRAAAKHQRTRAR